MMYKALYPLASFNDFCWINITLHCTLCLRTKPSLGSKSWLPGVIDPLTAGDFCMHNNVLVRIVSADALVLKYQVISTHNSDSAPPLFKNSLGLQGLYSATNCADNILGRFTIILQNQIARVDSFTNLTKRWDFRFDWMLQFHHIT